jgi:hypothetical protein
LETEWIVPSAGSYADAIESESWLVGLLAGWRQPKKDQDGRDTPGSPGAAAEPEAAVVRFGSG